MVQEEGCRRQDCSVVWGYLGPQIYPTWRLGFSKRAMPKCYPKPYRASSRQWQPEQNRPPAWRMLTGIPDELWDIRAVTTSDNLICLSFRPWRILPQASLAACGSNAVGNEIPVAVQGSECGIAIFKTRIRVKGLTRRRDWGGLGMVCIARFSKIIGILLPKYPYHTVRPE